MTGLSPDTYLSEIERVQNPALGAMLIWEYGLSFQENISSDSSHYLLSFLILPLCLHRPTVDLLKRTYASSGLGKFCEKLADEREELFAIHERTEKLKRLTLSSLAYGERAGLLSIDYENAKMRSHEVARPKIPERIRDHTNGAAKLGAWFSALTPVEIFHALRVEA